MQVSTHDEKINLALDSVDKAPERSDVVTLSSGVALKFKPVPILRLQAVLDQFPYPPVPEVFNPEKGRNEKWAGSEQYLEMRAAVDGQRVMALMDAVLVVGTEVHAIPEGFPTPEDDSWVEGLELGHIKVNVSSPLSRYHAWAKYVAIVTESDISAVVEQFGVQTGTSEVLVAEQLQTNFPDNETRVSD